uniref:BHLH7 n=1 Tax=Diospyros kaki TaxID=35925 RepID=A0A5P9PAL8_DIOKA|nr:bHLH7 [Diospyros kaki]
MALEAVVYPQEPFGYVSFKELYSLGGVASGWGFGDGFDLEEEDKPLVGISGKNMDHVLNPNPDTSSSSALQNVTEHSHLDPNPSPEQAWTAPMEAPATSSGRRKRRRTRSCKNKEELENQRMTHIAVERNRRKQMNEYLSVIRSLMPPSYVQRGDQASIIGGAINYVKELEQMLQTLESEKRTSSTASPRTQQPNNGFPPLFADFFTFPQYSTCPNSSSVNTDEAAENRPAAMANIEVTVVESHANLKILSKRRPRQLLKMVAGLQCLRLTVLLYSLNVKIEDGCQMSTVDEIADAVNHLLGRIEEEAALS